MKPTKHTRREKDFHRLNREASTIRDKIWDLGYTELEKPIRHGWYYEMVLNSSLEDNPKYKEAFKFLKDSKPYVWGKDKKTAKEIVLSRDSHTNSVNSFLLASQKEFNKFSDKLQSLCVLNVYYTKGHGGRRVKHIAFRIKVPSNYITFKYTKAYITHRRIIDPKLISRLSEIETKLESSRFYGLYNVGSSRWDDWANDFKLNRKKSKISLRGLFKK